MFYKQFHWQLLIFIQINPLMANCNSCSDSVLHFCSNFWAWNDQSMFVQILYSWVCETCYSTFHSNYRESKNRWYKSQIIDASMYSGMKVTWKWIDIFHLNRGLVNIEIISKISKINGISKICLNYRLLRELWLFPEESQKHCHQYDMCSFQYPCSLLLVFLVC